ncbi:hypothetical protein DERP_005129 [Dermatophagoides pteronyssinus]|uniref:Uncharacterized protein n=1 Tax=Dermatophagoides pteronyssinus TaxID=6956 RepID=A0ABQ8JTX4_DERPT|nr:hypothetical protein DERP_005129 [Dermatophagoides pteronyssinus]
MLKNYHHQQQQQLSTLSIMMAKFLRLFLLLTILLSIITLVNGLQSTMSSSMDDDNDSMTDQMKQMRRNEVSKALLLLKKHSIVGSNAKIVLKNNGRHLLVDPSERIRIVSSHLSKKSTSSTTSSKSKSLKLNKKDNNSNKSEKQRMKKSNRNHRKSSSSSTTASSSSSLSNSKDQLSKASRSIPSISVESVQRNIMRRASSKSPTVIDSLMGQHMLKDITEIITTIIRNKQASSLVELSDLITETLNERYGPHWHTISVASPKEFPQSESTSSNHEILLDTILSNHNQIDSLTHVAVDDHQKSAIFYVTFDFGRMLRIFIFK